MSLESRVVSLEEHHKQMDANLHSLAKVCADIKNIALTNQHDIAGLKTSVAALAEATHAGFRLADEQHKDFVREVRERFDQHDKRFDQHDKRFDQHDKRFDQHDKRFDQHDKRFDQHDKRFDQLDKRFEQHDKRFDQHDKRFDQLDKRFDQLELLIRQLLPNASN